MELSIGELHNLSELILSCVNSITNMAMDGQEWILSIDSSITNRYSNNWKCFL